MDKLQFKHRIRCGLIGASIFGAFIIVFTLVGLSLRGVNYLFGVEIEPVDYKAVSAFIIWFTGFSFIGGLLKVEIFKVFDWLDKRV